MASTRLAQDEKHIPFYPDHFRSTLWVIGAVAGGALVVAVVGQFFPIGLGQPADPLETPAHVKPEWYFLALYQLLKFMPKTLGAVLPVVSLVLLALWPFIDRRPERSPRPRQVRLALVLGGLILTTALTVWGEVS